MNFVEIMLTEKLKGIDPALDILGSDRKVLQVCCQDLTNYLKLHWELVGKSANECKLVEKLERFFKENPEEIEEFLAVWTGIWFKKWKQRVKLLIGNQNAKKWNKLSKVLKKAEPLWRKMENRQEIQEIIVATLIRKGEICGTDIISANLLKMELGQKGVENLDDKERVFSVVNNSLRRARDLAQSRGPLIFVKIDRGYYDPIPE
ncbi:hypothetical protein KAI12_03260 [Candidatus Bathyarchaeota archaeon]|nr:hypothetical protein [Candidatus Bathyarchaeota archaeon]